MRGRGRGKAEGAPFLCVGISIHERAMFHTQGM